MSGKKKQRDNLWLQCDLCNVIFCERDNSLHSNCCPPNFENSQLSFVSDKSLICRLEQMKSDDPVLEYLSLEYRKKVVFLTQSALQLCKIPVGHPVKVTTNAGFEFVRIAWKYSERTQLSASLFETENHFIPVGTPVRIEKLEEKLFLAGMVSFIFKAGSISNDESVLRSIKLTQCGIILSIGEILYISSFGKAHTIEIVNISPKHSPNDEEITKIGKYFSTNAHTQWHCKDFGSGKADNFEKVGGLDNTIKEVEQILELSWKKKMAFSGFFKIKGILLHGPCGTGKSLLMRDVANRSNVKVFNIGSDVSPEEFVQMLTTFVSVTSFLESAIITIDDLDIICSKSKSRKEQDQNTVSCLCGVFDRLSNGTIIIATAANANLIERCLRRPGRFDKEIEFEVPSPLQRLDILKVLLINVSSTICDIDLRTIADGTHGFVGSDLLSLVSKAVSNMILRKDDKVNIQDFMSSLPHIKPSALKEILVQVPNVLWSDIGGQDDLKHKLRQAIEWPLRHPNSFTKLGISPPRGVLMYGPPGCSKTMIAKALATETGLNFISVKGPELFSKWVGESEKAVREIFRKARQVAPSIVFFDELDALAGERSSGGNQVQERVLAQLLTEMDGVQALGAVTVVGATNRPDRIDSALLRPGRLDRIIYVPLPDGKTRREIFSIQLKKTPVTSDVNVEELVQLTVGYSGAEVIAICCEAAMKALDDDKEARSVSRRNFLSALDIVKPRTPNHAIKLCERFSSNLVSS